MRRRPAAVVTHAVVFGGVVGVGVMTLAIDTGLTFTSRQDLQRAADAAAMAAASQLGAVDDADLLARVRAAALASLSDVGGKVAWVDAYQEVAFGHAELVNGRYVFRPDTQPIDAVRVTIRRDATAADGPVTLVAGRVLHVKPSSLTASATAMLVPRDIAVVVDESASMNDDSELRHYRDFPSENGGYRPGVQIGLDEVWHALGSPKWGHMKAWGDEITLGKYDPARDHGLWRIPRGAACTDGTVAAQLTDRDYVSTERSALLNPASNETAANFINRVKVILGVAEWQSGKPGAAFSGGGDGDNFVEDNEITNKLTFPYPARGPHAGWDAYVAYVAGTSSQMHATDGSFRYRFGLKTVVNYLLESRAGRANTPQLAAAPEMPLQAVKDAVQSMIDVLVDLDTADQVALEHFAQHGYHIHNLAGPAPAAPAATRADGLQAIPDACNRRQAGHTSSVTNIGAGMDQAIAELTSPRARAEAAKVIILLTDGKPNCNADNAYVGDNHPEALDYALRRASHAKEQGMTVYTIGVGSDVNPELLTAMASQPDFYFFADSAPDPANGNLPKYVTQLEDIFENLGARRPVRLIP